MTFFVEKSSSHKLKMKILLNEKINKNRNFFWCIRFRTLCCVSFGTKNSTWPLLERGGGDVVCMSFSKIDPRSRLSYKNYFSISQQIYITAWLKLDYSVKIHRSWDRVRVAVKTVYTLFICLAIEAKKLVRLSQFGISFNIYNPV